MSATQSHTLRGEVRAELGKERAKKVRFAGKLPAVLYGNGYKSVPITLDHHEFSIVRQQTIGEQVLLNLELSNGVKERVFIKDVQRDPVTWKVLHVDFLRIDPSKPVRLAVRLRQVGQAPLGVREGGLLERIRDHVNVEALPDVIPGHIDIDMSELNVGDSVHVSDLAKIEGVTIIDPLDTALYTVLGKPAEEEAPKPVVVAAPAEGEAAAAEGGEAAKAEGGKDAKAGKDAKPAKEEKKDDKKKK